MKRVTTTRMLGVGWLACSFIITVCGVGRVCAADAASPAIVFAAGKRVISARAAGAASSRVDPKAELADMRRMMRLAGREFLVPPTACAALPFVDSIRGSRSPARNDRPPNERPTLQADRAGDRAANYFRRILVLARDVGQSKSSKDRALASRATAEAAWFLCLYAGRNGEISHPEKFIARIGRSLREDPRNPKALFMRAMSIWWERKSLAASVDYNTRIPARRCIIAENDLRLAVKIRPKFPEAWFALWLIGMVNGKTDAQELVRTIRNAKFADPILYGNLPQNGAMLISDARAFLKMEYPAVYKKKFGHQIAPDRVTLW